MTATPLSRRFTRTAFARTVVGAGLAVAVAASIVAPAVVDPTGPASSSAEAAAPTMASSAEMEAIIAAEFMSQFNRERAARGAPALTYSSTISSSSIRWADQMASSGTLYHSSDGRAEVVGYGYNSGQVSDAFMRSAGHRNIITDPNMNVAGFGVSCDSAGRLWVTVQFTRADASRGVQGSSSTSPIVTPTTAGSGCGTRLATGSVQRLYAAYFLRNSDQPGMAFWMSKLTEGWTLAQISGFFAGSGEFTNRYGSLSNRDFVNLVYRNVMNRTAEQGGLDFWTSRLNAGMSRGEMMIGFSESAEFVARSGIN